MRVNRNYRFFFTQSCDELITVEDIIVIRQGNRDWEWQLSVITLVFFFLGHHLCRRKIKIYKNINTEEKEHRNKVRTGAQTRAVAEGTCLTHILRISLNTGLRDSLMVLVFLLTLSPLSGISLSLT